MSPFADMLFLPLPWDADTPAAAAAAVSVAGLALAAAVFLAVRGVLRARSHARPNTVAVSWAAPVVLLAVAWAAWLLLS